jgi:hypothetical protein
MSQPGQFDSLKKEITVEGKTYKYYSVKALNDPRIGRRLITQKNCHSLSEFCWNVP